MKPWQQVAHLLLGVVLLLQRLDVVLQLGQLSVSLRQTPAAPLRRFLRLLQSASQVGRLTLAVPQQLQTLLLAFHRQELSAGSLLQLSRLQGFVQEPHQFLQVT